MSTMLTLILSSCAILPQLTVYEKLVSPMGLPQGLITDGSDLRHPVLCQNSAQPASTKELRLSKSG